MYFSHVVINDHKDVDHNRSYAHAVLNISIINTIDLLANLLYVLAILLAINDMASAISLQPAKSLALLL